MPAIALALCLMLADSVSSRGRQWADFRRRGWSAHGAADGGWNVGRLGQVWPFFRHRLFFAWPSRRVSAVVADTMVR